MNKKKQGIINEEEKALLLEELADIFLYGLQLEHEQQHPDSTFRYIKYEAIQKLEAAMELRKIESQRKKPQNLHQ